MCTSSPTRAVSESGFRGPVASRFELLPQGRDRVAERPRRRFLRGTIGARFVRGAVTLGAIGEMLDQGRAVVGPRPVGRPLRRGIDRQRIIAIDAQPRDAITPRARRNGGSLAARKARKAGNRPLVVNDVENNRRLVNHRKGTRREENALPPSPPT